MEDRIFFVDRKAVDEACALRDDFGIHAYDEAAARAIRCREIGNVVHFCRWRQIARLVDWMDFGDDRATIH